MSPRIFTTLFGFLVTLALSAGAWAIPTSLTVRVRAHDAKFVGSAVGGLQVTVRDYFSHEALATGMVAGGTGNTKKLMKQPRKRDTVLSGPKAAAFRTTLDIDSPRKLLVTLRGPLAAGLDSHTESKTVWLIPGNDIKGDGLLFEIYGLIVRNYSPTQHQFLPVGSRATLGAHVTPMCGCPVRPKLLWDANDFSIIAELRLNGKKIADLPLSYAGRISDFEASYRFDKPGTYQVTVIASDKHDNQGVDTSSYVVVPIKTFNKIAGTK